jgi:hypothetical protein
VTPNRIKRHDILILGPPYVQILATPLNHITGVHIICFIYQGKSAIAINQLLTKTMFTNLYIFIIVIAYYWLVARKFSWIYLANQCFTLAVHNM